MRNILRYQTLGLTLMLVAVTSACAAPVVPTSSPPSPSPTKMPSVTSEPSNTPTERPTVTPAPTITPTPPPEWVTNFAQPILDAIANRPPDFEDNFDQRSNMWKLMHWCGEYRRQVVDGEMLLISCTTYVQHAYTDFVVEVNAHFTPEIKVEENPNLGIRFRIRTDPYPPYPYIESYSCDISAAGHISCSFNPEFDALLPEYPGIQTYHLLIIAKGSRFAFYLNGMPVTYFEDNIISQGYVGVETNCGSLLYTGKACAKFDNYELWDISDLP